MLTRYHREGAYRSIYGWGAFAESANAGPLLSSDSFGFHGCSIKKLTGGI